MSNHKDVHRVAAGYKAAIRNPNVSAEAKEQAKEKLRDMGQDVDSPPTQTHVSEVEESTHVLGGYKATLTSEYSSSSLVMLGGNVYADPRTSEEAKQHAEEVLEAAGIIERHPDHSEEQHQTRVLAGYKAALHNPRVSKGAKEHAREYLKEHGVDV